MINQSYRSMEVGLKQGSGTKQLSQDVIAHFAELTGDRHPLHLDADYAAQHRFGKRIAHGALILSSFLGIVELDPEYLVAFYGIESLRFIHPAFSGDTIHAETEVIDIAPKSEGETAVVTFDVKVLNQDDQPRDGGTVQNPHPVRDSLLR